MDPDMTEMILSVLAEHGRLPVAPETLAEDADLYQAGMTSHASISVMLGLEAAFDVEFPDRMLTREVFSSIKSIRGALDELAAAS
jgi:acyl carrier protein